MKYYFIAFSLLMSTSAIAITIDDDPRTPSIALSLPSSMGEANFSSDEESEGHFSSGEESEGHYSSDEEPVFLSPISFQVLNPISPIDFTGLTPEEQGEALVDAVLEVNPGLQITYTEGRISMHNFILPPLSKED